MFDIAGKNLEVNVGETERAVSMIGGGILFLYGWNRGGLKGLLSSLLGGALLYRGAIGYCPLYDTGGSKPVVRGGSANISVRAGEGFQFEETITVNKPPEELYSYWRNLENLPRIMSHVKSVKQYGDGKSRWVVEGPGGISIAWDGEIVHEEQDRMIGWRSLPDSMVDHAGSVHFEPTPEGGTRIKVVMRYVPPAGKIGKTVAALFGEKPREKVKEDLRNFKQEMESGKAEK